LCIQIIFVVVLNIHFCKHVQMFKINMFILLFFVYLRKNEKQNVYKFV
jgi:hypothetical protein